MLDSLSGRRLPSASMTLSVEIDRLRRILTASLPSGVRAAELFIESSVSLDLELEAGAAGRGPRIEKRWESGAHLRRFSPSRGDSWLLDAPSAEALEALAGNPETIAAEWLARPERGRGTDAIRSTSSLSDATPASDGPWSSATVAAAADLIAGWLSALERALPPGSPSGLQAACGARLSARTQEILLLATDRDTARDTRRFVDATLSLTLREPSGRLLEVEETAGAETLEALASRFSPDGPAAALCERAFRSLQASAAPRGEMPVVFAPPSAGFLIHEVCGHLLEADHVLRGLSPFAGARGQSIASSLLTLADDGSIPGMRGSALFDDEGVAARRTPLILEGTLIGYLSDRATALATDGIPTGNGRRQSYCDAPMPRMTNLVIGAGPESPGDILGRTASGILVRRLGRGRVDPATGRFSLAVEEGSLIENGAAGRPVAGALLTGSATELLSRIDGVGGDLALDHGAPLCLKEDQAVPFGMMQPTLRVSSLAVSGPLP